MILQKIPPPIGSPNSLFSWICRRRKGALEDKIAGWVFIRCQTIKFEIYADLEGEIQAGTSHQMLPKGAFGNGVNSMVM